MIEPRMSWKNEPDEPSPLNDAFRRRPLVGAAAEPCVTKFAYGSLPQGLRPYIIDFPCYGFSGQPELRSIAA